jgi:hypothetical protein
MNARDIRKDQRVRAVRGPWTNEGMHVGKVGTVTGVEVKVHQYSNGPGDIGYVYVRFDDGTWGTLYHDELELLGADE